MIEDKLRGLGFGALATMNGIGDLCSSILIGFIWAFIGYSAGFVFAAVVAAAGTIMMLVWANRLPENVAA
jgi:dipeptide/tripeptide permease